MRRELEEAQGERALLGEEAEQLKLVLKREVQCAVCSVQCAVCSVQCAVCSVQCAVCRKLIFFFY